MSDEIEMADGGIIVRTKEHGLRRVDTPIGFQTLTFRNAVAAIHTFYLQNGTLPSVDDLYGMWPKIPRETYAALFETDELKDALELRGIAWDREAGLSMKQQMALLKLADPNDRRTLKTRLSELGVSMPEYQSWMRNPQFAKAYERRTKDAYKDYLPDVRMALVNKAMVGDIPAIDRILAITGEWDPTQREVQNARDVVLSVLNAVTKHTDPEVREKILADVEQAAASARALRALGA